MGLLTRLRSAERTYRATYAPWDDFWYQAPSAVASGSVAPETALRLSAVWACVGIRSEGMASLPLLLYRRLDRGKERASDHALYRTLRWQPNAWQTAFEFEELAEQHVCLRGNFYAKIDEDAFGRVQRLVPLHPDRVTPELLPVGRVRYTYRPPSGQQIVFSQEQIHHRRGRGDGVRGYSPIEYAARVLGIALAGDSFAEQSFANGATPPFALIHKTALGPDGTENLRKSLAQYKSGDKYLVLEEDMKVETLGISAKDAQLLDSREFGIEEIARFFNVPLHKLKVSTAGTVSYASVEMFDLDFVMHTLRPEAVRFEQAIWRDLLSEREQDEYVPEYLLEALLRGDSAARAAFYRSGIESRWLTPNEARERENLNPLDGGDMFPDVTPTRVRPTPEEDPRDPRGRPRGESNVRGRLITMEACARVVQKELAAAHKAAVKHANDPKGWQAWCREFYDDHAGFVGHILKLPSHHAKHYADAQCAALVSKGLPVTADWESRLVPQLAALALGETTS